MNLETKRSSYVLNNPFKSKFVEIIVFVFPDKSLVLIILYNSVNFILFKVSVPKSSITNKSTVNKLFDNPV